MQTSLRFAVIGCGTISQLSHLPAIQKVQQAQLVSVVDRDYDWASAIAKKFKARAVKDYRDLVGQIDAAIVATPNSTHAQISSDLLLAGVHVLCEKPLATSVADAEAMFLAARRGGARLMAGQSRRFGQQMRVLKKLIDSGALGKINHLNISLGGDITRWPARTDYRRQFSLSGGGVLIDTGVHLIDMALWLLSDTPKNVSCHMLRVNQWEVEDNAEVVMEMRAGIGVHLACSYTWGLSGMLYADGERGWARVVLNDTKMVEFFSSLARVCQRAGVQTLTFPENNPYVNQLAHFCQALLEQRPFIVSDYEIIEGLRVLETCYSQEKRASRITVTEEKGV
jgi:predicted dehydrogenase